MRIRKFKFHSSEQENLAKLDTKFCMKNDHNYSHYQKYQKRVHSKKKSLKSIHGLIGKKNSC